jgi:hypothetical protein
MLVAASLADGVMSEAKDREEDKRRIEVAFRSVIEVLRRETGHPDRGALAQFFAPDYTNPFSFGPDQDGVA